MGTLVAATGLPPQLCILPNIKALMAGCVAHKTPADELVLDVLTPTPKDSATGASVVIAVDAGLAVVACGVTVTAKKE